MAVELLEDAAATVEFYPSVKPASATLTLRKPGGSSVATPVVTVDTYSQSVSSVTDQTTLVVASASGLAVGRSYWWTSGTSGGHGGPVRVSEIDGTAVTLESPPPGVLASGDTLTGLRCTAPLTATHTATRGLHYRLEWTVTDAAGATHDYRQAAHVVRVRFHEPISAAEVARYVSRMHPGAAVSADHGYYAELADRASTRVRRRLEASGRYPHLVGEPDALRDAGLVSLRLELSMEGLIPAGMDPQTYADAQEKELDRQVELAVAGLWHDSDDDGAVDVRETQHRGSIGLVRS